MKGLKLMKLQKVIVKLAYKIKPVLLYIVPTRLLRNIKKKIIDRNYLQLSNITIDDFDKSVFPVGVNLIGCIKAETGLGQSCRLLANELNQCSFPFLIYNYNQIGCFNQKDTSFDQYIKMECKYGINIIHINPHELGIALMELDKSLLDKHYNIGFWLWELEVFPDEWLPSLDFMDEIWTPSEFISNSIRKKTCKPVITIPYCIEATTNNDYGRKEFGLPDDKFLFLMMYDNNSVAERKNPFGVINAFKKAFKPSDKDVGLVVKITSAKNKDIENIKKMLIGYENIYFITTVLNKQVVNSLIKSVDVVVSLHRAEGFGLVMAEAMYLCTPVIATNWSANTEFMNNNVACMVNYELIEIEKDLGPFKKGQRWAEPNVEQAAEYMVQILDSEYREKMIKNAANYIRNKLSIDAITTKIEDRISQISKK